MTEQFDLRRKIEKAFKTYDDTLKAVDRIVGARHMAQEIIILLCARLDSLANFAFGNLPQEERFFRFLVTYSGQRKTFEDISVPDLYYFLRLQQEVLPGTIEKPGRIHIFSEENLVFIRTLWKSGLAIDRRSAKSLLEYMHETLRTHFYVQPNKKNDARKRVKVDEVLSCLTKNAKGNRLSVFRSANVELRAMIERFQIGRILYRDYRCTAIHEYVVSLDENAFFRKNDVYWRDFTNDLVRPGRYLTIEFPARFLRTSLEQSLRNYKRSLNERKLLPSPVFNAVCNLSRDLQFLDVDSIDMGRDISLNIARG